jgi:hypothetical protein
MARLADPAAEECGALLRKEGAVVAAQIGEAERGQRHDMPAGQRDAAAVSLEADIPVRQLETGPGIVCLLRKHAVEADIAAGQAGHRGVPQLAAVAPSAPGRPDDVAANEGKGRAVPDGKDAGHRLAADQSQQESAGIGGMEALAIVQSGNPSFGGGPVQRRIQVAAQHGANFHRFIWHRALLDRTHPTN